MEPIVISGKVAHVGDVETVGQKGTTKQTVAIEFEDGKYTNVVAGVFLGKSTGEVDKANPSEGDEVELRGRVKSREYNGKWYTDFMCFGIKVTAEDTSYRVDDGEEQDDMLF